MFSSPKQQAYLAAFKGVGEDEEKAISLTFYITPVEYELAMEIDPHMADRLFRNSNGGDWLPAQEMPKASFSSIQIPKQNVTFHPHDQKMLLDNGVLIPSVKISNLRAARAFPDKPDFRLEFEALVPMDKETVDLVRKYYKAVCFLSMEPTQGDLSLEDPVMALVCRLCEAPNPEFATTDGKFAYCFKHDANHQEGETLRRIRDHQAAAAVAEGMREPGNESENEPKKDPLADDINQRNQMSRRKRK